MKKENIESLLIRYLLNETTPNEQEAINNWIAENTENKRYFEEFCKFQYQIQYAVVSEKIQGTFEKLKHLVYRRSLSRKILWMVAGIVLLLTIGSIRYFLQTPPSIHPVSINTIEHISTQPILYLSTGEKIPIQTQAQQLQEKDGTHILISQNGSLNYDKQGNNSSQDSGDKLFNQLEVPRGCEFKLTLSDGTFILLAPCSKLTYPIRFDSCSIREVFLEGEAYFEIRKSSNRFIVHTEHSKLQVYGTIFNVFARKHDLHEIVLLEGKIGITPKNPHLSQETILKPGYKTTINEEGEMSVEKTNTDKYIAKSKGFLLLDGEPLTTIIKELELYYDVLFKFSTPISNTKYVVSIKRDASLQEALNVIESVTNYKFTIKGKEVFIQ